MTSEFTVVIPARYASTRLPGKPLADIGGRPMIAWVHERARASGAAEVLVATDDARVAQAARAAGARVELTSGDHASGTDRIAEVAVRLGWPDEHIVVNVQGDEPLMPPVLITQVAELLASRPEAAIATLMTPRLRMSSAVTTAVAFGALKSSRRIRVPVTTTSSSTERALRSSSCAKAVPPRPPVAISALIDAASTLIRGRLCNACFVVSIS